MIHPVKNSSGASNPTKIILAPDPAAEPRTIISNGVNRWERADELVGKVEQTVLVTFLGFMIVLAFLQIVLRNFFFTGLDWGDSLLRNLVLWVGFVGATLATKEGKHINIDIISRRLPSLGKNIVTLITHLFSFLICCGLTYAAIKFIKNEIEMGNRTFLNIPAWIPEMILPTTFILMTFRFGLRSFGALFGMGKTGPPHDREKET
jgi:TRAP-type C4-dicarboxylate transport system permease small subunit